MHVVVVHQTSEVFPAPDLILCHCKTKQKKKDQNEWIGGVKLGHFCADGTRSPARIFCVSDREIIIVHAIYRWPMKTRIGGEAIESRGDKNRTLLKKYI